MKINQKLFFYSLLLFCFLLNSPVFANAPSSLSGKKITITVPSKDYDMEWYVLEDGTKAWLHELEDGEWELDLLTWSKTSSNQGTIQLGVPSDYIGVQMTFYSSSAGSFTYNLHESDNGGPVQIVDSGSGTFTSTDFDISEIPFDNYFEDQFSDQQISQAIWPLGTAYGITIGLNNNSLQLTGTLNDSGDDYDQRWYAFSASSILSTANDWKVSGSSFAKIDVQNDFLNYQAATGVELRNSKTTGLEFEISIGLSSRGIMSEIYVGDFGTYDSQYHSIGIGSGVVEEGSFRVVNDSSNKILTTQYLSGSEWQSLYELHWDTGVLNDKINNSEIQLNNWTSFSSEYVLPVMDFSIPHTNANWNGENIEVIPLEEGELGFTSFSVTEETSEPIPEYAPASLAGKIYQGSLNDTYQFVDESKAIFYHQESSFQNSEISNVTYTWSASGKSGTLTTSLDETTTLSFSSTSEGTFQWQENGGSSTNGSFTLTDASSGYAPLSLEGDSMIVGTKTYIFKENGIVTIRSTTGSVDSTYGFVKSENNEIVFTTPTDVNGVTSTLYKMIFSSTGAGSLYEGGSGSFKYFIDGSNQPSSKGWMWFDQYPWVYSEIEEGWLYFHPTGSKIMAYSSKDQIWREME
ncbi:MAG: hypothetical protein P8N49_08245 [Opitutales bacterium]|nr:hypothetical protein [Opitutales bacterium]